jgi:hypothetical protein
MLEDLGFGMTDFRGRKCDSWAIYDGSSKSLDTLLEFLGCIDFFCKRPKAATSPGADYLENRLAIAPSCPNHMKPSTIASS